MNRYAYAGDNPIDNTDPTGRSLLDDLGDISIDCQRGAFEAGVGGGGG
jgi:hypothetical protein